MKYVIISFFLFISINLFGQKKVELKFITNGVCEMCENRIEKSLLKLKGVWTVEWDVKTEETLVVYFPKKFLKKRFIRRFQMLVMTKFVIVRKRKFSHLTKFMRNFIIAANIEMKKFVNPTK